MKAAEDFLTVVLYHIVAAVKEIIAEKNYPYTCHDIAHELISKYISFSLSTNQPDPTTKGTSYPYAVDILTLGMLWLTFHDASREGDGDCIIRCLLLVFQHSGHRNYAFNLLAQMIMLQNSLVPQLVTDKVFKDDQLQSLSTYKKNPLFSSINWSKLTSWVGDKIIGLDFYSQ